MKKNAIWFSRHPATPSQLAEITDWGFALVAEEDGLMLGSKAIQDDADLCVVMGSLGALIRSRNIEAVFGVFSVPMQYAIACATEDLAGYASETGADIPYVPCFGAWNVQRSVEGQKPTFEHKTFLRVGMLRA